MLCWYPRVVHIKVISSTLLSLCVIIVILVFSFELQDMAVMIIRASNMPSSF